MNSENSTNCKSCDFYHGKDGLVCANHPCGFEGDYCPDYQETIVLEVTTLDRVKTLVSSVVFVCFLLSFVETIWFGLTSLSLAGLKYSWKQLDWENLYSSKKVEFVSELSQSAEQVWWLTIFFGSFNAFIFLVIGGLVFIIAVPYATIHVIRNQSDLE
jgi:apolipoprotein N-acyltransferase